MTAKKPLSGSNSTPKSAWNFTAQPSPPTLVFFFREFDDALGLTEIAEDYLQESRTGRNILHHLVPLLRQSIYSRLAGYDDTNDAVRLSQDPAMRVIVGWQGSERKGASTSEMGRFETEFLTQEDNLKGLARINTQWVERAMAHTLHRRVILDMDSSESHSASRFSVTRGPSSSTSKLPSNLLASCRASSRVIATGQDCGRVTTARYSRTT